MHRRTHARGLSLAVVMMVLTIVFGFTFFISDAAMRTVTITQNEQRQKSAAYAAEAAASMAYAAIKNDQTYNGTTTVGSHGAVPETAFTNSPDTKYSLSIWNCSSSAGATASDGTSVPAGAIYVIATGKTYLDGHNPNSRVTATRTCSVMMTTTSQPASIFNYAAFGATGVTVTQGAVMDAYDSSKGAYGSSNNAEVAQVGSNGNVTTSGGITLPGDVASGGTFSSNGSLNIKGKVQAVGNVTLGGAGTIGGGVMSSGGNITLNNSVLIKGTVAAGGTVSNTNAPTVMGDVTAVGGINWTGSGATIQGNVISGSTISLNGATVGANESAVGAVNNTNSHILGNLGSNVSVTFHNAGSDVVSGMTTAPSITLAGAGNALLKTYQSANAVAPSAPSAPPTVTLPPVDTSAAKLTNQNATITVSAAWSTTGSSALSTVLDNQNNLNITQGQTVTLKSGTYYFKTITLANAGTPVLKIDPSVTAANPVKIYVDGNINVAGGNINNSTQLPGNLQIYSASTNTGTSPYAVQLTGSSAVYAALYCPQGSCNLSASGAWFGSIVAGSFTSSGGAAFHYDISLAKLSMSNSSSSSSTSTITVQSWNRQ